MAVVIKKLKEQRSVQCRMKLKFEDYENVYKIL